MASNVGSSWRRQGSRRFALFIVAGHCALIAILNTLNQIKVPRVDDSTVAYVSLVRLAPVGQPLRRLDLAAASTRDAHGEHAAHSMSTMPFQRPVPSKDEPTKNRSETIAPASSLAIAIPPQPAERRASEPLVLSLTRQQLGALERDRAALPGNSLRSERPYLAALAAPGANEITERALPHGELEVHVGQRCFVLQPSAQAKSDPFNHANETLVRPC